MTKDDWKPGTRGEAHTTFTCGHCKYQVTASGPGAVQAALERMADHECDE